MRHGDLCRRVGRPPPNVCYNPSRSSPPQSVCFRSYHASPPWTSCPRPDLLPAAASLGGLTELRLLQRLRRSPAAAQIALVGVLRCLADLGLHDTVVGHEELRALARCRALRSLAVSAYLRGGQRRGAAARAWRAAARPRVGRGGAAAERPARRT